MALFRLRRSIKPLPGVRTDALSTSEDPAAVDLKEWRPLGWVVAALIVAAVVYNVLPILI